jgi:HAD superfamily hydrolase (TIGR01450 family)
VRSVRTGTWIVDLDGVVWLAGTAIAGASEAIDRLRAADVRVLFVTNNSAPTLDELVARLARVGITAPVSDLVTSAEAAAALLAPGDRVFSLADGGATEALLARGVQLVNAAPADAVLVGWTHDFDFERLTLAAQVVRAGARLIGTNEDATHPTPEGLLPGAGALLAAVATAADAVPDVAGKPHPPIVRLIAARTDDVSLVVGDRPSTDGALAEALGVPFGLVLSGVTASAADEEPAADYCAPDLLALVTQLLATTDEGSPVAPPTRSGTVESVPDDDGFQRYVDAATALAQLARGRIEEIARDLAATGEAEGGAARQWTDDLLERSRSVVDEVVDVVRTEVTRQLDTLGLGSPEDLLRRLSEMFSTARPTDRSAPVRDVVAIDATTAEPATSSRATKSRATKSSATKSGGRQRTTKPKGADKKKPAKKVATAAKGTPHTASKAAQKSAKASGKKAAAKKSAGRGT